MPQNAGRKTHKHGRGIVLLFALFAIGCGGGSGGGDGGPGPVTPSVSASFAESGVTGAADLIRLTGNPSGDLVTVSVAIGGPTTSSDLYSFAFDLVLGDPTVAELVGGSESPGAALQAGTGQTLQVLATQQGDRVTVGVTKLGGGAGNGVVDPGETVVVDLVFRLLKPGTTSLGLAGSQGGAPAALDSTGASVGSVTFDLAPASLIGT